MVKTFSKDWTDRERLRLVILLTSMIRDDINLNRYGQFGRPNIQSVHEMIVATPAELEMYRSRIDAMVDAYGREKLFADWDVG
jgi:hypothetical protein